MCIDVYELHKSINRLCEFLDDEYGVNDGGCCYLAFLIAHHLECLEIPYHLVIYDLCSKDTDCIQSEITTRVKNKSSNDSVTGDNTCNHYSIYIKGVGEVNSRGFEDLCRYVIKDVKSSNIKWIYRTGSWNSLYDTVNNKTIRNIIRSFFNPYETVHFRKSK